MSDAAKAFAENEIGSAPVVDESGRCIGMLSVADFMKCNCPQRGDTEPRTPTRDRANDCPSTESPSDMVNSYMTTAVHSVSAAESLLQAARLMSAEHIHHLPVLDGPRPIGVVSTMDVVAALINAVEEVEARLTP
jgi:CBS domain-containing protein